MHARRNGEEVHADRLARRRLERTVELNQFSMHKSRYLGTHPTLTRFCKGKIPGGAIDALSSSRMPFPLDPDMALF